MAHFSCGNIRERWHWQQPAFRTFVKVTVLILCIIWRWFSFTQNKSKRWCSHNRSWNTNTSWLLNSKDIPTSILVMNDEMYKQAHTHARTCTHTHTQAHAHIQTQHTHTHTHTHTHHSSLPSPLLPSHNFSHVWFGFQGACAGPGGEGQYIWHGRPPHLLWSKPVLLLIFEFDPRIVPLQIQRMRLKSQWPLAFRDKALQIDRQIDR